MLFRDMTARLFAPEDGTGAAPAAAGPASEQDIMNAIIEMPAATRKQEQADDATTDAPTGAAAATSDQTTRTGDTPDGEGGNAADGGAPDPDTDEFDPFENTTTTDPEQGTDDGDADEGSDAALHTISVDGQDVEVTLGQLKRAYSGEGAISGRLQKATATLNEAKSVKDTAEQEAAAIRQEVTTNREQIAHALTALRSLLTAPRLKQPDPALKVSNPTQYLLQKEAFEADQNAMRERGGQLDSLLEAHKTAQATQLSELRKAESIKLAERMPVFKDPVKGKKTLEMIMETAKSVGFSPADVAAASDHRLFVLATKAAMYDKLMAQARKGKSAPAQAQTVISGKSSGATNKNPVRVNAARQAALNARARETGSVDDVAATLIIPGKRR